jgi:DNA (cytosine-5)-methyltransferase 1
VRVAGLFSGIGGIELGLREVGHEVVYLCEIDDAARRVLTTHFDGVPISEDVNQLGKVPDCDLIAAGFPCQDLSPAGRTAGIGGQHSGLVASMLDLLEHAKNRPEWVLLENVPFMLQLQQGKAMALVTGRLEKLGYQWAYRILDSRGFGLPQRRRRVLLLASRSCDPRPALLGSSGIEPAVDRSRRVPCGFYWTEGNTGVGWAVDSLPPLKGGSGLGIPSAPAIWMTDGSMTTPHICDAERLQGFVADWTKPAEHPDGRGRGVRWRLVGNAVSVPVARWVGARLATRDAYDDSNDRPCPGGSRWPSAGWGQQGTIVSSSAARWPLGAATPSLASFLRFPTAPLSRKAAEGFLVRAKASSLHFEAGFLDDVELYVDGMREAVAV